MEAIDVPRLHLVTPLTTDLEVVRATRQGLAAGAPLVQVRCKDVTDRDRYHHTGQLRELCAATGAMCLVNDRVDLALAVAMSATRSGRSPLPADCWVRACWVPPAATLRRRAGLSTAVPPTSGSDRPTPPRPSAGFPRHSGRAASRPSPRPWTCRSSPSLA